VDEQKHSAKTKRRRSRAEVEQLVGEYEASGLSYTAFCRQTGLSISTLARYRKGQQQRSSEATEAKRWLSVEVAGGDTVADGARCSGLAVVAGGRRIEVGRGFDAETLNRLLAVVERG
jgi:transposase-like protein